MAQVSLKEVDIFKHLSLKNYWVQVVFKMEGKVRFTQKMWQISLAQLATTSFCDKYSILQCVIKFPLIVKHIELQPAGLQTRV